jgi:hypothetical protein
MAPDTQSQNSVQSDEHHVDLSPESSNEQGGSVMLALSDEHGSCHSEIDLRTTQDISANVESNVAFSSGTENDGPFLSSEIGHNTLAGEEVTPVLETLEEKSLIPLVVKNAGSSLEDSSTIAEPRTQPALPPSETLIVPRIVTQSNEDLATQEHGENHITSPSGDLTTLSPTPARTPSPPSSDTILEPDSDAAEEINRGSEDRTKKGNVQTTINPVSGPKSHKRPLIKNWKPNTLRAWFLVPFLLFQTGIICAIIAIQIVSARDSGLTTITPNDSRSKT